MKKFLTILSIFCIQMIFAAPVVNDVSWMSLDALTFETNDKEKVVITPNPARDNTVIKIMDTDAQVIQVSIYSLLGNQIFSKNYAHLEKNILLNVQPFKKGKYLVKITFKDGSTEVKALIKQ